MTKADIITQVNEITNETQRGANTASRVGGVLSTIVTNTQLQNAVISDQGGTLDILDAGVYLINQPLSKINLPNPANMSGAMIVIINSSGSNVSIGSDFLPASAEGTYLTAISGISTLTMYSIADVWRYTLYQEI